MVRCVELNHACTFSTTAIQPVEPVKQAINRLRPPPPSFPALGSVKVGEQQWMGCGIPTAGVNHTSRSQVVKLEAAYFGVTPFIY